jgi:hypothetical protein
LRKGDKRRVKRDREQKRERRRITERREGKKNKWEEMEGNDYIDEKGEITERR